MLFFRTRWNTVSLITLLAGLVSSLATAQTTLEIDASNSPFYLPTGYHVTPGDSLTLGPGAVIYMGDSMDLIVEGYFRSQGTEQEPVLISALNPAVGWGAIDVKSSADSISITHTIIDEGKMYINGCPTYLSHLDIINNQPLLWSDIVLRIWFASPRIEFSSITGSNLGEGFICHDCIDPIVNYCTFIEIPDAIEFINCSGGRIANCEFQNILDDAIDLNHCADLRIDSNTIHHVTDRGIEVGSEAFGSCENIVVTRNIISDCQEGINFKEGSTGVLENNTIFGNEIGLKTLSVAGFGQENVKVSNCIFSNNDTPIIVDTNSIVTATYNCFSHEFIEGQGNFIGDPQFNDPIAMDFQLREGSLCINNGNPLFPDDPDGSPIDIGVHYRKSSVLTPFIDVLHIWPVPSNGEVIFRFPEPYEYLEIMNTQGKIVFATRLSDAFFYNFDTRLIASGLYYIRAEKKDGVLVGSFIVD